MQDAVNGLTNLWLVLCAAPHPAQVVFTCYIVGSFARHTAQEALLEDVVLPVVLCEDLSRL